MVKYKEYYEEIARQHTGIQAVMHTSKPLAWYRHFLETTVLRRYLEKGSKTILDLGCGNGRFFPLFRKQGYEIHGLDFSQELINQASNKFAVSLCVSSCSELPYVDSSFNSVFLILTLPHDDQETVDKTLQEISRVIKPGGKLFIIDEPNTKGSLWNKETLNQSLGPRFKLIEDRFISSDAASRLLSKNGYKDIKTINANKESRIRGNTFKDIIKILINMWIDIPSVLFRRKNSGVERLLIFENQENKENIRIELPPH